MKILDFRDESIELEYADETQRRIGLSGVYG